MSAGEHEGLAAGPGVDDRAAAAGVALRIFHAQPHAGGQHGRVGDRLFLRGSRVDDRDDVYVRTAAFGHTAATRSTGCPGRRRPRRHCQQGIGVGGRGTAKTAKLLQAAEARRADHAARLLAVDDHHEARNGPDSEALGQVAILFDVHSPHRVSFRGKLLDGGVHRTARAAMIAIEVQEHGFAGTAAGDRHGDQRRRQREHRILPYLPVARGSPLRSSMILGTEAARLAVGHEFLFVLSNLPWVQRPRRCCIVAADVKPHKGNFRAQNGIYPVSTLRG